jgi:Fe-S-cluster containining protein
MDLVIKQYADFLALSTERYNAATRKHNVKCKPGCHECCTNGFFDITLLDALYVRSALAHLPVPLREYVVSRAHEQLDILEKKKAFSRKSPLLRSLPEIDAIWRRSATMSCPALDRNGACLIYNHRPHICRIFGPTLRGPRRIVFLRGCDYFTKDMPANDISLYSQYVEERNLLKEMFLKAGCKHYRPFDTIIPAALTLDLAKWIV